MSSTLDPSPGTKGEQTRRAILEAAIERFGRAPDSRSTSVADIARDAGVGGSVTYSYFPNKEALFLAAMDEDAAAVITEGMASVTDLDIEGWRQTLIYTLLDAVDEHPLARRLLAGLEPEVTYRVLEIPALSELRHALAERIRSDQDEGAVRRDVDAASLANGLVSILLSLLMSLVQIGSEAVVVYGPDVAAVFEAALDRTPPVRPTAAT